MNYEFVDLLRFGLIIAPSFLVLGYAAAAVIEYSKAYMLDRKIAKVTGQSVYGLLPRHVVLIATSHICLVLYVMLDVMERLGRNPRVGFFFLAGIGIYTGLFALYTMSKFQRKRHNDAL
jgi:hypothetical protein